MIIKEEVEKVLSLNRAESVAVASGKPFKLFLGDTIRGSSGASYYATEAEAREAYNDLFRSYRRTGTNAPEIINLETGERIAPRFPKGFMGR